MTQEESEAIFASAISKLKNDERTAMHLDNANQIISLVRYIAGGLIAITLWVGWVQFNLVAANGNIERNRVTAESTKAYATALEAADKLLFQSHQSQLDIITTEMKKREKEISETDEMWFLHENGISNRAAFFSKHGYAAPSNPGDEPSPLKHN